jgi:amphi-Trp domain-containing protein
MGKSHFGLARPGPPEESAEYLEFLAAGLERGEVCLEASDRILRLVPSSDVKLEIKVRERSNKGRIELAIAWKRPPGGRMSDLKVGVGPTPAA